MRRLHSTLYLSIIAVLVLFTLVAAAVWHSVGLRSRFLLHGAHIVLMLGAVAAALALLAYPVARGITARLTRLNAGVQKFGAGDLAARVPVEGDDEVATLARSFNDSAARIEQLVRANQMLLANCSHELRTPLARLRLAAERLASGDADARAELTRNVGELDALIGELLLASRLDAALSPARQDAVDLLGLVAEEASHFDLEACGEQVVVDGDAMLLRRLVRNLLENARIHASGATAVRVARMGRVVQIIVDDDGPGIPPADREHIFEPFFRGAEPGQKGMGLGLAIVRQIARVHGGDVTCEPRQRKGSRFIASLPSRIAAERAGSRSS